MDALEEEAISGGKLRASPKHHFPVPSVRRPPHSQMQHKRGYVNRFVGFRGLRGFCCLPYSALPCIAAQESRRGRGSVLTQTMTLSRRSNKGGGVSTGANTYAGSGGSGRSGGGGSAKAGPREEDLRKILQSRHPFPPTFHLLLYMDRYHVLQWYLIIDLYVYCIVLYYCIVVLLYCCTLFDVNNTLSPNYHAFPIHQRNKLGQELSLLQSL